jgi:linearmycin/streptolysin S transport system permease protein
VNALLTIARKDLKLLTRNKAAAFWVLGFPIFIAMFFGTIWSGGGGQPSLSIAVVDQDQTEYSRRLVKRLASTEALKVRATSLDSAVAAVRHGDLSAYVALRPGVSANFGFAADSTSGIEIGIDPRQKAMADMLRGLVTQAVFMEMRESFSARGPGRDMVAQQLEKLRADTTMSAEHRDRTERVLTSLQAFMTTLDSAEVTAASRMASVAAADSAATAGVELGGGPAGMGDSPRVAAGTGSSGGGSGSADKSGSGGGSASEGGSGSEGGPNIQMVEVAEQDHGPRTAYEVTFPSALAWALIGTCMSFAISIVYERLAGTFLRLRLAPVSRAQVVGGKALACFLGCIVSMTAVLLIGILLVHIRITNPLGLAAAMAAGAFCFTGVMMLIGSIGRSPQSVSGAGWAVMLIMSMTGGGAIPLFAMPPWMQTLSNFSLVKWAILGVEGAVWRGFTWAEMALPLGILFAVGAIGLGLGARALGGSET